MVYKMKNLNSIYSIGVMSGTSLDGVDIALCLFENKLSKWHFNLLKYATYAYSNEWKDKLQNAQNLKAYDLIKLHKDYGFFIGELVNIFNNGLPINVNIISSHGHTIFHNPAEKVTFQLGDGSVIAATTGITTISDFRTLDVAMCGQGAPLVPIGDKILFKNYDYCLNLGGIANVSYDVDGKRIAFDICPVNMALNYLSNIVKKDFDKDGVLSSKGTINSNLLEQLNLLDYYYLKPPKSLSREWFEATFLPLISNSQISVENRLATVCEHIAIQISKVLPANKQHSVLTTGGGALNKFLVELMSKHSVNQFVVPTKEIVEFKEAIIFAFLGVLRLRNEINVLSSATGAKKDTVSGVIHKIK